MRAVIQRVSSAHVKVEEQTVGQIRHGLLILLGVGQGDTAQEAAILANKISGLRIFEDEAGKMNRSLLETGGAALVVSQFTLYADTRKGRRPSFGQAAAPDLALGLYEHFVQLLTGMGIPVATGQFQAHMAVTLVNDGPVTLVLDTAG